MKFYYHYTLILLLLPLMPKVALAFPGVNIRQVSVLNFENAANHGIKIQINNISDANLSSYELHVRQEDTSTLTPWVVYNHNIFPFHTSTLNIPYRNAFASLKPNQKYCLRIRAIYGNQVTPWSQQCNVVLGNMPSFNRDTDGDGILDHVEIAQGLDPRDKDSDRDNTQENDEITIGRDPNRARHAKLVQRISEINFGDGDPFGRQSNQHAFIILENIGADIAKIDSVTVEDGTLVGSAASFKIGMPPQTLSHLPPKNIARIPVSFLPQRRGPLDAVIKITSANSNYSSSIRVSGRGVKIPDCQISPATLDFGTVDVNDQGISRQFVTIANRSPDSNSISDAPLALTLFTSALTGLAPGVRNYVLPAGEEIRVPVLFQHPRPGVYDSDLLIKSPFCGVQKVQIKARAQ